MNICPKCGYERQAKDYAPAYECPKCGIVYNKYVEKIKREAQLNAEKINPPRKKSIAIFLGQLYTSRASWKNMRIFVVFLASILMISIISFIVSDYGTLRWRYWNYTRLMTGNNVGKAYVMLSKRTKELVPLPAWKLAWGERDLRLTEQFKGIEFNSDKSQATIASLIKFNREKIRYNRQTWLKIDDSWYRDFAYDQPEEAKEMRTKYFKKLNSNSQPKIVTALTLWETDFYDQKKSIHLNARISFAVENGGSVPITYLKIRLDFYDVKSQENMGTVEHLVIDSIDNPLQPSERTKIIVLRKDIGSLMEFDGAGGALWARNIDRPDIKFSFKRSYDDDWVKVPAEDIQKYTNPLHDVN